MTRLAIVLTALLIGAAAPARAWCEASCLAPTATNEHCPTHEPASNKTSVAATAIDDCPVIEPTPPVKSRSELQFAGTFAPSHPRTFAPRHSGITAPQHLPAAAAKRLTPLRI